MTEKETVAQMLRRANSSNNKGRSSCYVCKQLHGVLSCGNDMSCPDMWGLLADRIEAEIEEARSKTLCQTMAPMAVLNGWPHPKSSESPKEWIDRCFLPRPLFEDGEPVQWGDIAKVRDDLGEVHQMLFSDSGCQEVVIGFEGDSSATHYMCVDGERVKRPDPEVLDADGVPIKVGDTVWLTPGPWCGKPPLYGFSGGLSYEIVENKVPGHIEEGRICIRDSDGYKGFPLPSQVTHKEPDTQEKIDADATMEPRAYYAKYIGHDVGLKDDAEITEAVIAHLLRRQRELDERLMGGE